MHASTTSNHSILHPSQRSKNLVLAIALASLAVAGFVLPFVWDVLATVDSMPKMAWLTQLLAGSPIVSWMLMFAWGATIPMMLLFALHQAPAHRIRNGFFVLVLMFIAITWFVHMPSAGRCDVMYRNSELACSALRWGFSTSLGLATAAYVFTIFVIGFSSLGLFAQCIGDNKTAHAS